MSNESLVPHIGIVTDVRVDTPDVKTFRVQALTGGGVRPGQQLIKRLALLLAGGGGSGILRGGSAITFRRNTHRR